MNKTALLPEPVRAPTSDSGRVHLGGGYRLPAPVPTEVADTGRINLGGGYRLPAVRAGA